MATGKNIDELHMFEAHVLLPGNKIRVISGGAPQFDRSKRAESGKSTAVTVPQDSPVQRALAKMDKPKPEAQPSEPAFPYKLVSAA